jgi:hypothetical protein
MPRHLFVRLWLTLAAVSFLGMHLCPAQSLITSNTPTASDAQQSLQERIREQSDGRIKLVSWNADSTPFQYELDGQKGYIAAYNAEIEFTEPCGWESRFEGKSATFKIFKPDTVKPISGDGFEVSKAGERFTIKGTVIFKQTQSGWAVSDFRWAYPPERTSDLLSRQCMNNVKQIGLDYVNWAQRHNGKFPFNVSTNAGGSKELCLQGDDGFEKNPAPQFQILANGLIGYDYGKSTPKILVCPADTFSQSAVNFQELQSSNVSYQLHCCTNNLGDTPPGILMHCPIHGWTIYTDGSVQKEP